MTLRKLGMYGGIALGIWFIIEEPATAAHFVHGIGQGLSAFARGLATFFADL